MPAALVLPSQSVATARRHFHSYVYCAYWCHVFPFYAPVTRTCAGGSYIGEAAEVALVFSRPPARYGQLYPLQPLLVDIFCVTSAGVGKTLTSHRSRYISSSRLSFHPESMKGLRCPSINQYGHFSLPRPAMKHHLVCVYLLPPLVLARQFIMCKPTTRGSENPLGGKFTFMFTTKPPHGMTYFKRYLSGVRRITGNSRNRFAVKSPTGLNQEQPLRKESGFKVRPLPTMI